VDLRLLFGKLLSRRQVKLVYGLCYRLHLLIPRYLLWSRLLCVPQNNFNIKSMTRMERTNFIKGIRATIVDPDDTIVSILQTAVLLYRAVIENHVPDCVLTIEKKSNTSYAAAMRLEKGLGKLRLSSVRVRNSVADSFQGWMDML